MLRILPVEVWELIATFLSYLDPGDGRKAGEQWQVPRCFQEEDAKRSIHPLKVFSQTCRLFADIARPILWRHVYLNACRTGSLSELYHLTQLRIALQDPRVAKLVQSITIYARMDEHYTEPEVSWLSEEFWSDDHQTGPATCVDDLSKIILDLGPLLPGTDLRAFAWRGAVRPPPPFYDYLARCQSLTSFTLDLGSSGMPCSIHEAPAYPPDDDSLHLLKDLITEARIGLGGFALMPGRHYLHAAEEGSYYDLRFTSNGGRGPSSGLVQWLGGQNKLKRLYIAAPVLYCQPWILPLWAKLSPQDVDQKDERAESWGFGERLRDEDIPYELAAKSFRPLLLESECSTPEDVLDLIASKEELKAWRVWHWKLEGETQSIMDGVLVALQQSRA